MASSEVLLVLGVMCTENARERRDRARAHYQKLGVPGILVKFFVDGAWLRQQSEREADDVVAIDSVGKARRGPCTSRPHARS